MHVLHKSAVCVRNDSDSPHLGSIPVLQSELTICGWIPIIRLPRANGNPPPQMICDQPLPLLKLFARIWAVEFHFLPIYRYIDITSSCKGTFSTPDTFNISTCPMNAHFVQF